MILPIPFTFSQAFRALPTEDQDEVLKEVAIWVKSRHLGLTRDGAGGFKRLTDDRAVRVADIFSRNGAEIEEYC